MVSREPDEIIGTELLTHPEVIDKNGTNQPLSPIDRCRTFGILVENAFVAIWRHKQLLFIQMVAYVVIAVFIGIENRDVGNNSELVMKNVGCIFFSILFLVLIGTMPTILTFPRELADFVRKNHGSKYSMIAFYFAKSLIDLPFHFLFASIYTIIVYALTSQPLVAIHLYAFAIVCVMTSLVSYSLGLLIAVELSGKPNTPQGIVTLMIIVPLVLFTTFIMEFDMIPEYLRWIAWISFVRYAFEGALISVYGFGRARLECSNSYCYFRHPSQVLDAFAIEEKNFATDASALVYVFSAFQMSALILLVWKIKKKRWT